MNIIHRSIWNEQTGTFVAVSENTRSAGKKISSCTAASSTGGSFRLKVLAVSLMMACGASAYAQPAGGVVSAGSATIGGTAGAMTITQTTPNVAINWQSFGIKAGESVQFVQPGSSSVALNRVIGSDPSNILGSLSSNGKVFLVNPNGILFGRGASVNVGGLVASTLAITDANFMANHYKFSDAGLGAVVNQGTINAADGGYIALLGANVSNQGVLEARLGTVALAAGNAVTLDMAGDKLLNVTVDQGAVNALVDNGGMLRADGGQVLMTTQAAGSLLANAVNNTGVVQAQTLVTGENGTIKLLGGMESGTVNVAGTLDASAPKGSNGGFVETSAAQVKVQEGARVTTAAAQGKTGHWLIDPPDFTIGAGGDISGTTLGANLLNSDVTILSSTGSNGNNGDIHVNDAVTWTAPTTLTLEAVRDVNINQAITATNGSLVARGGRNVNADAAITTTTGNLTLQAANNVTIRAKATITTGNLTAVAGGSVYIDAPMTVTTGDMVLRADNDGTGPGADAGTVAISCGSNCLTITTGNLIVRFNPVTYASTLSEIGNYEGKLTGGGLLDAKAWVFGKGDNKIYDGTRIATVSGLAPDVGGTAPAAALGAVSNANFDTKHVGTDKPITFDSTFNHAVFDLFAPAGTTPGTYVTRADITVRPLTVNAVTDTRVYNGATSSAKAPVSLGLQAGDTLNGTLTQAYASKDVLGTGQSTLVANGPYSVSDGNGGNNYSVTVNTAPGTITPAPLVLTADNQTKTYGQEFVFSGSEFKPAGLLGGDTITKATLGSAGAPATAHVAGSPYAIDISAAAGCNCSFNPSNYTITYVPGLMTVTPAPLTVTANDAAKVYGQTVTLPTSAFTSVGLQNGETISSVTETSPGTVASAGEGPYAITPTDAAGSTFMPGNYAITYTDGTLTVTPVVTPPVVTPPVVTPPVVTPPVVTPPVVIPPVVTPPVVIPPVVIPPVVTPPVVTPPVVTMPVDTTPVATILGEVLPETPYQGPIVKPQVTVPGWMPVVVAATTPPQLLTLAPPVSPLIVPVEKPVLEAAPVEAPPQPYVAPQRPRRQDRN